MRAFTTLFILFCLLFPLSSNASLVPDTTRIKELIDQVWATMYTNPDSALELGQEALKLSRSGELPKWEALALNRIGVVNWAMGEYEASLDWYSQAAKVYENSGDSSGLMRLQSNIGLTYSTMGYYEMALEVYLNAAPYIEATATDIQKLTFRNNLAIVYKNLGEREKAVRQFEEIYQMVLKLPDPSDTAMLHNNIALLHRDMGHMDTSFYHHRLAVSGYRAQNQINGLINALFNFGGWYSLQDSFPQAAILYDEALQLANQYQNTSLIGMVWLKKAELDFRQEAYTNAIQAGDSALHYLPYGQDMDARHATFELLNMAHAKVGNFEEAYGFLNQAYYLRDTLVNAEKSRRTAELTMKYETELKDKEIANLQQQEVLDRWQKGALATTIGLLLLIAFLVFRRQRAIIQREKALQQKTQEAAQAREALSQAELKAASSEKQLLEEEVRHKSKELSNLALGIIRHHELLQNLDKSLQTIRKKATPVVREEVKELAIMVVSQLGAENERQDLQLYIEEAQQSFFQMLDQRFPQLTARERRLCALIRLGYSSKEIAALFNINPSSVDMGRYRLRKKLDPNMEVTLNEFLAQLAYEADAKIAS